MFNPQRDTIIALWRRILLFVEKRWVILSILILLLVNIYVFYDGLHAYLAPPDDFHHIHTWTFGQRSLVWVFLSNTYGDMHAGGHYRPFEVFSFMIDTLIWNDYTAGRHLTNLVFHFLNTILVLVIAYFITQSQAASFIVGLLFSIHPAHFSAVAWISGRTDVIATTFCLSSFVLFILFIKRKSLLIYMLALVAFLCGLLSKEIALVVPLLALSFELFFSPQHDRVAIDDQVKKSPPAGRLDKDTKFWSVVLLTFGLLSLSAGLLFNPGFVAKHIARDSTLAENTISWIKLIRWYAIIIGGLTFFCGIFFKKAFQSFAKLPGRYSLCFFILLGLYLPIRMQILGSIGGYNYEVHKNVNTHMQMSLISVVRDFYGLLGLFWPVDFDYSEKILLFQKNHEILFFGIFAITVLLVVGFAFKYGWKHKPTAISLLVIPILGLPVHNILIRNTYTDPRYLYLPTVGACLFAGAIILGIISSPRFRSLLARVFGGILLLTIIFAASAKLREFNKRFADTGQVMRNFVASIEKYKNLINKDTDFYFLTFPSLPIDIDRHIWVTAVLQDAINFVYGEANWDVDDLHFIVFVDRDDQHKMKVSWVDGNRVLIEDVDIIKTKIIPASQSTEQIELATIYDPSWLDPHPVARPLKDFGAVGETKVATIEIGPNDYESSTTSIKATMKESMQADKNNLFLIYNQGKFELAQPGGILSEALEPGHSVL